MLPGRVARYFLGAIYQNRGKLLNVHTDVPNGRKIFQMAINY
jgi:hypothetical protein